MMAKKSSITFLARVAILIAAGVFFTSACGSDSDTFEELVAIIEEGTTVIRNAQETTFPGMNDLGRCDTLEDFSKKIACMADAVGVMGESNKMVNSILQNKMPGLKARATSLNLSSESPDASRARDGYVRYMAAWQDFWSEAETKLPTAQAVREDFGSLTRWAFWDTSPYVKKQKAAMIDMCVGLESSQPKNNSYRERLIDICGNGGVIDGRFTLQPEPGG